MFYLSAKRIIDLGAALTLLILFSPVILAIIVLIKREDPGPAIFTQTRVGRNGKLFSLHKLRSMRLNADEIFEKDPILLQKFVENNWKLPTDQDPRVLKIGRFIRKTSLDELVQFWDVLLGHMSIVGPRAFREEEIQMQQALHPEAKAHIQEMLTVKPGITGAWQIGGRNEIDFVPRVEMEAVYAKRRSILYDFWIMLCTPFKVIHQEGVL
jgi:lipopolysaccharide/colanic/teichoic acid biosynthesis glycosyltransferase